MKEFLSLVLGDISIAKYLACLLFAILGVAVFTFTEVSGRDVKSEKTPILFSWKFLALDNIKRYVLTGILIFLQFRFSEEVFHVDLNVYTALTMGFNADGLAGIAKQFFAFLKADREMLYNSDPYKPPRQ